MLLGEIERQKETFGLVFFIGRKIVVVVVVIVVVIVVVTAIIIRLIG